ncbi:hypothetical protein [Klebsiella pneumoniae]|uniref:hypothetical protein n=1 Tax=Klebsiella pneumoniae TaxID=573 RepID=UPI0024A8813E|nr:hypothetical protein [Klebsiella pneumoniae]
MTNNQLTRERLQEIAEDGFLKHGESKELARMALAAMDSEPVILYRQVNPANGMKTYWAELDLEEFRHLKKYTDENAEFMTLYRHAQQPVVPENRVTAEHRRVIEMLLNVCGAAFELADDSCQQDVDGEDCHVVPDDAFQKLSDALDEIENTLPTEDIDRPDVFLAWSAMPRAALKSILQPGNSPVIPDGYVMVPMRLTAENGAKGALSGEFSETKFVNCPECFGDDECETCDGSGTIEITVPVTWTTIKEIWAKGMEHFAAAPQENN